MNRSFSFIFLFICTFALSLNAQIENLKIGATQRAFPQANGGVYDYSAPGLITMHVSVWGYVKFPGRYIVPTNISVTDIASYAGGPTGDALLEDVRLLRTMDDSTQQIFSFNFNELMHEPKVTGKVKDMTLLPGDVIIFPGEPRFYFRDYFSMTLSVVSTLISLSILILNIVRK